MDCLNPWLNGLLSAALSGAAAALGPMLLDEHFSTRYPKHLAINAGFGALIGVVNYLRVSPLAPAPTVPDSAPKG